MAGRGHRAEGLFSRRDRPPRSSVFGIEYFFVCRPPTLHPGPRQPNCFFSLDSRSFFCRPPLQPGPGCDAVEVQSVQRPLEGLTLRAPRSAAEPFRDQSPAAAAVWPPPPGDERSTVPRLG